MDSTRLVLFFSLIAAIYGLGILAAGWAGALTARVMQGGGDALPYPQWAAAFALLIAGMLAVVYGVFFRPREVRVSDDEVMVAIWDGTGKSIKRAELEGYESSRGKVVLVGAGKRLVIDRTFAPWNEVREAVEAWANRHPA